MTGSDARAEVIQLAERLSIPVAQGDTLFDDFPTNHPLFLGNYNWPMRYPAAVDLVINLGAKMPPRDHMTPSDARVVHVSLDPGTIGRVVKGQPKLARELAQNFLDYQVLAQGDQLRIEQFAAVLDEAVPVVTVPNFSRDVHDVRGLAAMHPHLFPAAA